MNITVAGATAVVYTALLIGGGLYAWTRLPSEPDYQATVALPFNHFLIKGDLSIDGSKAAGSAGSGKTDLTGYTKSFIEPGQRIHKTDLAPLPLIIPDPGDVAFSVTVDSKSVSSGDINAGVSITLSDGHKYLPNEVRVLAVSCIGGGSLCTAALETPATGSDEVIALIQGAQSAPVRAIARAQAATP